MAAQGLDFGGGQINVNNQAMPIPSCQLRSGLRYSMSDVYGLPMCHEQFTHPTRNPVKSLSIVSRSLADGQPQSHVIIRGCDLIIPLCSTRNVATGTRFNASFSSEPPIKSSQDCEPKERAAAGEEPLDPCRMRAENKAVAFRDRDTLPSQPVREQPPSCFSNSGHRPRNQSQRESPYHFKRWMGVPFANRNAR